MKKYSPLLPGLIFFMISFMSAQDLPFPKEIDFKDAKAGDIVLNSSTLKTYKADFGLLAVPASYKK